MGANEGITCLGWRSEAQPGEASEHSRLCLRENNKCHRGESGAPPEAGTPNPGAPGDPAQPQAGMCRVPSLGVTPPAGLSTEPLQLLEGTSLKGDSGGKDQPSDTQWLPPWAETQRKKKEVQEEA